MSNAIRCIDQRFAFKNSRISCLALIFNLKNPSTTVLYAKKSVAGGEIRRVIYYFFQVIDTNLRLSCSGQLQKVGQYGFDSWWLLNPSAVPWPFCVALSQSVHWHVCLLYCWALYNFFFLGFCQWLSRADRVVNLNMTILLALVWRTWTQARASTRPHVWAWHMGSDYIYIAIVEPQSWLAARSVALFFPDFSGENTEKKKVL